MKRRDFFASSAGYSPIVLADRLPAARQSTPAAEIRQAMDKLASPADRNRKWFAIIDLNTEPPAESGPRWRRSREITGVLARHRFAAVETGAVRLRIAATNGDELARVFEVRCYA